VKKKISRRRNLLAGILLTVFAVIILGVAGFFILVKYSQAPSLAKLLPNEETLVFGELRLDGDTPKLTQFFGGTPASSLLEVENLALSDIEELFALAENRIGVAFFGESLDPQNFALVLDAREKEKVLAFFEKQTLDGEELQTENYLHQKIYYFPRSRNLAFMFPGKDVIIAPNLKTLQNIAESIHIPEKRIENSEGFRQTIAKLNPREDFIFLSPKFINALFANRFEGMGKAFATPLLDLWEGGGVNFVGQAEGIEIKTRFVFKNLVARDTPFLDVESLHSEVLNLFGEETQTFFASGELSSQLTHFLEKSKNTNSPLATLTTSWLNQEVQKWFGDNFTLADFTPLFENTSAMGISSSGGMLGVFEGEFPALLEKLEQASGKLASEEKLVELPDTTPGHELVVKEEAKIEEDLFASNKITRLKFPDYELNFAQLGNFFVFTSEREVLEKMIARFVAEERTFEELVEKSEIDGGNIFYTRVENSEVPLLQPFLFTLAGVDFETDGMSIEMFLGK